MGYGDELKNPSIGTSVLVMVDSGVHRCIMYAPHLGLSA